MTKIQATIIGCGGMARHHVRNILLQQDTTHIPIVCEPSPEAYQAMCEVFEMAGVEPPPNEPDLERLLAGHVRAQTDAKRLRGAPALDAAFIITPHAYHHDHARACLEAGLDVLLEKPMVMNADEARSLIETRDRTGRLLVVAFNGSLSPQIRKAVEMLRSGELGELRAIRMAQHQRHGVAGLGAGHGGPVAPAARDFGRRVHV